jgi:hypothetical protein
VRRRVNLSAGWYNALSLVDFACTFAEQVREALPDVHPAGASWINGWLVDLRAAACGDDAAEVAVLTRRITRKLEEERCWAAESAASARISPSGVFTLTLGDDETRQGAPA